MERQMTIGLVLTVITAILLLVFAFRQPQMQTEQRARQLNMTLNEGAHLFVTNQCYACHGLQGQGVTAPGIAGTRLPIEEIVKTIANGRKREGEDLIKYPQDMPPFGSAMRPHQIESLAIFLQNWDQGRIDRELLKKQEADEASR